MITTAVSDSAIMSDPREPNYPELSGLEQFEANNFAGDDFETLDPDGSGVYESHGTIPEQDEEVTTTNPFGGEEPAEEDRYAARALDLDNEPQSSDKPLINWGDEEDEPVPQPSAAAADSQGSPGMDDFAGLVAAAPAGAQSAFDSAAPQDPLSKPTQETQALPSAEPLQETHQESKPAGRQTPVFARARILRLW